jgi:hypothetical protein
MALTLNGKNQTVLQVAQGSTATATTTSSGSFTSLGLSATITPLDANSKILIIVNMPWLYGTASGSGNAQYKIYKNGNPTSFVTNAYQSVNGTMVFSFNSAMLFQDSVNGNKTSTTYSLYGALTSSSAFYDGVYYNWGTSTATMQLMEIG